MSNQEPQSRSASQQGADAQRSGAPRLDPRPLERHSVDPASAAAFGRPHGVDGAFDTLYSARSTSSGNGSATNSLPPPASLTEAFGRPYEQQDVVLQRPPDSPEAAGAASDDPLWASMSDPWRDPGSGAVLGGPAVPVERESSEEAHRQRAAMLSVSEVLTGKRVQPTALGLLAVIALLIGSLGGVVGWFIAQSGNQLTGEVTISEAQAGKERPPGSVADIAQRVAPAVVSIEVRSGQRGGVGSGVVIDPDGYIITNHHVISTAAKDDKAKLMVVFTDGTRAEGTVVGSDPKTDLAVIKVNVTNPTVIQVGKSSELVAGDKVIAVGSPFGLENTVTEGIVSALNRPITAPGENGDPPVTYDAIQTDAAINPGNSGGALVDSTGALIGINSLIRTVGNAQGQGGSIGLGFAIPIDQAIRISESLIRDGKVAHAELGISVASVSANTSEGAQVQDVRRGGPAAGAGIAEGDVIIRVADRIVRNAAELTVAVRQHEVGAVVPIKLVRDGREFIVDVTLGSD
ncbi:MAG: trypsin-like peptidase domain-containing protein [Haloechinothrix sp.]